MRSVAIVGSHPLSRDGVPYDDENIEIWVFNEAAASPWAKRVDVCFQMHKPPIWKNLENLNYKDYANWIKEDHGHPTYMLEQYDEVPSCVPYPLNEIVDNVLPSLSRGQKEKVKTVFSSSISYAIALAIYKGFERILIFGVEMDSNTEYSYQRNDVYFWIGIATGKGIKVVIQENSKILTGLLYGYEGDVTITEDEISKRISLIETHKKALVEELEKVNKAQVEVLERATKNGNREKVGEEYLKTIKDQAQVVISIGTLDGSIHECKRYLAKAQGMEEAAGQNIFARQEFERTGAVINEQIELHRQNVSAAGSEAFEKWKGLAKYANYNEKSKRAREAVDTYTNAHQKYVDAAYRYGMAIGAFQENAFFIQRIDEFIRAAGGEKARLVLTAQVAEGEKL